MKTPSVDAINQSIINTKKDREILEKCLICPLEIAYWVNLPPDQKCRNCNVKGFDCDGDTGCINIS